MGSGLRGHSRYNVDRDRGRPLEAIEMVSIRTSARQQGLDDVKSSTMLDVLTEISNNNGQNIPTVCQGDIQPLVYRRR
jgi:hypothetical protein